MTDYKDYYRILGVNRDADGKAIKKAYRNLARKYHPDTSPDNPQAEERFKEVNEAHEVLSDPQKRAQYDRLGRQYQQWQRTGGSQSNIPWEDLFRQAGVQENVRYQQQGGSGSFSDFFDMVFGGRGGSRRSGRTRPTKQPIHGRDVEHEIVISLEEAYRGATRVFKHNGKRLNVRVPPGAKTGTRVRLSGKGEPGFAGGRPGDLYLVVTVLNDEFFDRDGDDLVLDIDVDLYTAVLGGETIVPTLGGDVRLRIPVNTQTDQVFRLTGKGMPNLRDPDQHGDLYAHVRIRIPDDLTGEELALFQQLSDLRSGDE